MVFISISFWRPVNAQTGEMFRQWGLETLEQIESDFGVSHSDLYKENRGDAIAFAWPQGIALDALIANGKIAEAEAHANEFHNRYWCYTNNIWGYNAVVDGCGDRYYDDNAWLIIALMELYEETNDDAYLERAKEVTAFSMSGENSPGGISWHEGDELHYSICSTAPTAVGNLMIYKATNIEQYKTDGLRLYEWMKSQGWGIGPGYRGYENAVQCQAAILLYEITGNETYREDATHLGLAMETFYINAESRALHETAQWGGHDMTNAYVALYEMDGDQNWLDIAAGYLKFLHDNCKDHNGRYPEYWSNAGADGDFALLYQAPVARAYATMGSTPGGTTKDPDPVAIFERFDYEGWSAGFEIGQYTLADMNFHGVRNDDISAVKVQPGFQVTFYDDDNFQGTSHVVTSDNSELENGWWNDRVSSFIVSTFEDDGVSYGDGLLGYYYNGMDFESFVDTKVVGTIDFEWGYGSPFEGVNGDEFSVRWVGEIQPRYSETYTFHITSDNGRRVWINDQLIIDEWVDDWGVTYTGSIELEADQKYDIKIEYFEYGGGANCRFEWSSPSQALEIVPQSRLYAASVTSVQENLPNTDEPPKLSVYPNPAVDDIYIELSGASRLQYSILNIAGQTVLSDVIQGSQTTIDLRSLEPGYYFIKVNNEEIKKILKY